MVPLTEKREGSEHPYRVVDRSDANFGESPECELRLETEFSEVRRTRRVVRGQASRILRCVKLHSERV